MRGGLYVRRARVEFLVVICRAPGPDTFVEPRAHGAAMRCAPAVVALSLLSSGALAAQQELRPALSGRATSVVSLSIPRPEGAAEAPPPRHRSPSCWTMASRTCAAGSFTPTALCRTTSRGAPAPTTRRPSRQASISCWAVTTLPAGKYVLYTIPTRGDWKLIIQKRARPDGRVQARIRRSARGPQAAPAHGPGREPNNVAHPVDGAGEGAGELRLAWGTSLVSTTWSVK